ncbi:MAG: universal stress protein [Rhodanobacteraceae bacterium]
MRDILAFCADAHVFSPSVRYAAELAASLGASLNGIHVSEAIPLSAPPGIPPSLLAEFVAYAQDTVQSAMFAGTRFKTWAHHLGVPSAQWHVALGDAIDALAAAGNWNDVLVIERRVSMREDSTELISELLLSGVPCIAVPEATNAIGRLERIAVAFNGSQSSIRALHAAIPLLRRATHVVLLQGVWGDPEAAPIASDRAFDPLEHLRKHAVAAAVEHLGTSETGVGDVILKTASKRRVDLLVAGAEGKHRRGDCRLAPLPNLLLQGASMPLFMMR